LSRQLFFLIAFTLFTLFSFSQVTICTWNIEDIGKTKSKEEIGFIARTIKGYDIVAIQEVVAKDPGGAQAIARLADALNRSGSKWDYTISNITSSSSYKAERYAFLWKTANVKKIGEAWLEPKYSFEIDREPYFASFEYRGKPFTLVNFHAITKSKQPETEIKYFKFLPAEYPSLNLIFCGDFNCPQSHSVFNPLKGMGYKPVLVNQKTSLKQRCKGEDCLASEFDNIIYDGRKIKLSGFGVIAFYTSFIHFEDARKISDHMPVWMEFEIK
jgi:endonuclease/exonuclease/phosphatase family metal-dependent hydrolase